MKSSDDDAKPTHYHWSLPTKTGLTVHIYMEKDEEMVEETTTDDTEVEIKEGENGEAEDASTETTTEEDKTSTGDAEGEKLTYEQKLARATTPEEKFAVADAEANKNRRLLQKANKSKKPTAQQPTATSKAPKEPGVEETVLLANGMPEELLKQLKKVAAVNGTTLLKAQTDPIFVAVKEKFEKEDKRKQASLGGGRGAGTKKPEKNFFTPGLSRDEHKAMARAAVSGK